MLKNEHGYSTAKWNQAKAEATRHLQSTAKAKNESLITYDELAKKIRAIRFSKKDPRWKKLGALLGQISKAEHKAKRGMLSAIVVNEKGMPGDGFFELAKDLKLTVSLAKPAKMKLWASQLKKVWR